MKDEVVRRDFMEELLQKEFGEAYGRTSQIKEQVEILIQCTGSGNQSDVWFKQKYF